MRPEGRAGAEEGAADPEEASIDKTLLHYITPDVRASPRSHNINARYISRLPSFRASSYFSDTRATKSLKYREKHFALVNNGARPHLYAIPNYFLPFFVQTNYSLQRRAIAKKARYYFVK